MVLRVELDRVDGDAPEVCDDTEAVRTGDRAHKPAPAVDEDRLRLLSLGHFHRQKCSYLHVPMGSSHQA